ncbi:hypothetical protein Dda_8243 [Drechslerella dactyloides]|uniref:Uncharacterized protein n=1 Tax=Drechslerella dactyloides TaxID=74499 RepID=A0AAD6IRR4_DREDA|nr:hypothetical protein Dda_8243 [Drechslerella dactyloides]
MLAFRIPSGALLLVFLLILNTCVRGVHASWWKDATKDVKCFFGDDGSCEDSTATATPTRPPKHDRPERTEAPTVSAEPTKSRVVKTTDAPSSRPAPTTPAKHTSSRDEEETSAEPTTSAAATTRAPTSTFTTETVAETTSADSASEPSTPPASSTTNNAAAAASNTSIDQALASSSTPGPKIGIIAGGIVAGVLVFAALGVGASYIARRRWRAKDAEMARQRAEQMNFGKLESTSNV